MDLCMCNPIFFHGIIRAYLAVFKFYCNVSRNFNDILAITCKGTLCFIQIYLEATDVEISICLCQYLFRLFKQFISVVYRITMGKLYINGMLNKKAILGYGRQIILEYQDLGIIQNLAGYGDIQTVLLIYSHDSLGSFG